MAASTTLTPEQRVERARKAGKAAAARRTPDQQAASGRKGHLAQAVKAVVDRAPELTPAQLNTLRTLLAPGREAVSR